MANMNDAPRTHREPIEPDGVWTKEEQSSFKRAHMTYLKARSRAERTAQSVTTFAHRAKAAGEKFRDAGSAATRTAKTAAGTAAADGGLIDRISDGIDATVDRFGKASGASTDTIKRGISEARIRAKSAARRLSDTDTA
ncbi:hypothetical protein HMPREF2757_01765 [Brevibacterium sp. HMSC063G07]|nr:hypothetical protein HMPREF2757_01765 [Brevibacterium sp. HMSC063G07]OFS26384.1 hypothetical protein HMPREF3162_06285 [Brevibacterium sp. HMSC07C04]